MPKVEVKLSYTTAADKKGTTTISNVNPSAGSAALLQMSQAFNALTTNTYGETNRVETVNLDTEEPTPAGKNVRTVTLDNTIKGQSTDITIENDGTETLAPVFLYSNGSSVSAWSVTAVIDEKGKYRGNIPSAATELYIGLAETNDYYPVFKITQTTAS